MNADGSGERQLTDLGVMSWEAGLPIVAVAACMSSIVKKSDALESQVEAGKAGPQNLIGVSAKGEIELEFELSTGRSVLARLDLDGKPDDDRSALPPLYIGGHVDHLGRGHGAGSLARGD